MKKLLYGWLVLTVLLGGVVKADYVYTTFFGPGATQPFGINDDDLIVGTYYSPAPKPFGTQNGFLSRAGLNYSSIRAPDSLYDWASGINNSGQIAGYYQVFPPNTGLFHGFLLSRGQYTTLDVPGSTTTQAFGISNSGQIVGSYNGNHGFLLTGGIYTTLDVPGSTSTVAHGINASGQIVGQYVLGNHSHGFLLNGGTYTAIDVPGPNSNGTQALGINGSGQIVGSYSAGKTRGFLLSDGNYTPIDVPGTIATIATGINDSGEIVGYCTSRDGIDLGFLATPVPEPATLSLLGIMMLALVFRFCRERNR